jgi:hypothetical protein
MYIKSSTLYCSYITTIPSSTLDLVLTTILLVHYTMSACTNVLDLPAETRNLVYRHVLSSPSPLEIVTTNNGGLVLTTGDEEDSASHGFNRLKFVNEQLHSETTDLELQFNDIIVRRHNEDDESVASKFLRWVQMLPPYKQKWLNGATVVLSDDYKYGKALSNVTRIRLDPLLDSLTTMARLATVCKALPGMVIQYHLPELYFSKPIVSGSPIDDEVDWEFVVLEAISAADWYLDFLRNDSADVQPGSVSAGRRWRRMLNIELEDLSAPNLQYLPHEVEDREQICQAVERLFGADSQKGALVIRWMDHGI